MKRTIACFMVFLTLFQFYSCTKAINQAPTVTVNNKEINITYLDDDRNPTEAKTDKIAMSLKDETNIDVQGFTMFSEKTGENEYTAYLTDKKSRLVISFVYKDNAVFPHKITVFDGEKIVLGTVTPHRKVTQDFDIIWHSGEDTDSFIKVPLKNDFYSYIPFNSLDSVANYQIKTIMISVRIWKAISDYVDNTPISKARGWSWKNFWHAIVAVVIAIVVIVVAVFAPIALPALGIAIAAVGGAIGGGVLIAQSVKASEQIKAPPDEQIINIKNTRESGRNISNGDIFRLNYSTNPALNTNTMLFLDIISGQTNISQFQITVKMNPPAADDYNRVNGRFAYEFIDKNENVLYRKYLESDNILYNRENILKKNTAVKLKITKIDYYNSYDKELSLHIETGDNVIINGVVTKDFKIILE